MDQNKNKAERNKIMKKIILMALAASIAIGSCCGCSKKNETSGGEEVTLKWVMPGPGEQKDSDIVWKEFNEKLKTYEGLENVSVDFDVVDANDYAQKFLMAQTSGDDMDIVQTFTLDFTKEAYNGTFAPLDGYLDNELADTKNDLPEFMLEYGKVNGSVYAIMNYQMCPGMWALNINKEIADKYIDISELREVLKKKEYDSKVLDILEQLLSGAAENGELGQGFRPLTGEKLASRNADALTRGYTVDVYDNSEQVRMNYYDMPSYKDYYDRVNSWYQKGYIRKDILSISDLSADVNKKGGYIAYIANNYVGKDEYTDKDTGVENYVLYIDTNPIVPSINAAGGNAIYAQSKHKDAAAKVINLMNSEKGKDLYNLLVWGIEGKHYNKVSDDRIETIGYQGQGSSSADYGLWKWVVGNTKYAYETQADDEGYKDFVFNEFNEGENTVVAPLIGFKPDLTSLESSISQMNSVMDEFSKPLSFGAVDDVDKVYNEFINKLKQCDSEKVKTELQKQVDEFVKNNK